jgi:hypothetical protein
MVYLNLLKGLDKIGVPYLDNDYAYVRKNPGALACIIGKPQVLLERQWKNPVLFGASVFSHAMEYPNLLQDFPVRKVLVPGEWMRKMFEPYYGKDVLAWPVGIDTEQWKPSGVSKDIDLLIYDKVRWEHDAFEAQLIKPIRQFLKNKKITVEEIRYGFYKPEELHQKVQRAKAVIFLCEHETQGLAYQQILSTNVPILAWDRGGYWQDPSYYPDKVRFREVSSVPYWDERCGTKFRDLGEFKVKLGDFWHQVQSSQFAPREYILENLTLEKCAQQYVDIVKSVCP